MISVYITGLSCTSHIFLEEARYIVFYVCLHCVSKMIATVLSR